MGLDGATRLASELQTEFLHLSKPPKAVGSDWARPNPAMITPSYLEDLLHGRWAEILRHADRQRKARLGTLSDMAPSQRAIAKAVSRYGGLRAQMHTGWTAPAKRSEWPEVRQLIAEHLRKQGLADDRIDKALAMLGALDEKSVGHYADQAASRNIALYDNLAFRNLGCLMGAMLAAAVASFNILATKTDLPAPPSSVALDNYLSQIKTRQKNVWQALQNRDLDAACQAAEDSRDWSSTMLLGTLPGQLAAVANQRRSDRAAFDDDGTLAVHTADIARELLFSIALGQWVSWLSGWGPSAHTTKDWLNAAAGRAFETSVAQVAPTPIAVLQAEPSKFDGKILTVRGVLGPVEIVHRGSKVVSSAPLSDAQGNAISVVLPYIKLDSGGLAKGAYAVIEGAWYQSSNERNGPALQLGRHALADESKDSWLAWCRLALRGAFEQVPHGLTASWSWETGPDGAGNGLRYGTWIASKEAK